MSSPEMSHRDQDFDYEVIEAGSNNPYGFMQTQIPVADTPISNLDPDEHEMEESEISVADHYKGTPPLRTKKKAKNRMSHEIPSEYQVGFFLSEQFKFMIPNLYIKWLSLYNYMRTDVET